MDMRTPASMPRRFARSAGAFALAAGLLALALGGGKLPTVAAQLTGQNKPPSDEPTKTISVQVRLVVEAVTVKDKKGNPIDGLSAKDFTITEDGVAQKVSFCEHQTLPETAAPLPPSPARDDIKIYNRLGRTQVSAESAGQIKYKDHRLLALYFDMSAMPPEDQMRALAAAEKFVRKDMTEADLLAIMRYNAGSMDVLQDFTADRNRILSILETMVVGEGQGNDESTSDDSSSDTGAAFGQDDPEFNIFTTDRQLAALQTATEALSRLNEKKELIYFSSGLNLNGIDNQAQLHSTIDAAIRSGVSFWTVDSRGLVASGPLGNATQGSQGGTSMYTGGAATSLTTRFELSQDTMYALAGDTGGKALLDNNDLDQGIVNAQHSESNYYILGYYSSDTVKNGKFRKIKVTVGPPQEDAKLDYRVGYWADKEWGKFNTADKERQLEDALMQGDPWTDLTVALELNYFQMNRAEYWVPVEVKIPGRELALAKKHGAESTVIDFVDEVKDDYGGTTESNKTDTIPIKLSDATAAEWAKRPIDYHTGYTLLPGKHTIKVLARDDVTGTIGTFQTSFIIPNLVKETKRVPISTVVLSSQRAAASEALFNASKGKEQAKEVAADPLVQNGLRLVPSVTRVFSRTRSLYVYLQAYEETETPSPLIAFVTFYQGQTKVMETQPLEVSPLANSRLETVPLNFTVDLAKLQPGKYDCQVTVLDPTGNKSNYWQAPIMVVQ